MGIRVEPRTWSTQIPNAEDSMPTAAPSTQRLISALCFASLIAAYGCSDRSEPLAPRMAIAPRAALTPDIVVTSTADNGPGTLRDAVQQATPGQIIGFDASIAGQTITLSNKVLLDYGAAVTIDGGSTGMTISGGSASKIFFVASTATLTLRNLTLADGVSTLTGGAMTNEGTLTIENSTLKNNFALDGGGALYNGGAAATARLVNTTLSGNSGGYAGGIISDAGAQLTLINTTIGNSSSLYSGSSLQLTNAGPTVLENSILAVDANHMNCYVSASTISTVGLNVVSDATCGSGAGFMNADAILLPLGNNGGPTETQALDKLSPAIDAGSSCSTTEDQRHAARPLGGSCDAGAVEFDKFSTFGLTVDASVTVNPKNGVAVVTGTMGCSEPTSAVLDVTLMQQMKVKRVPAVVQALAHVPIACTGPASVWSAALVPVSGAFESGTGTASAVTATHAPYFLAASASTATRMYWGHK